jgi:hypothetical protein
MLQKIGGVIDSPHSAMVGSSLSNLKKSFNKLDLVAGCVCVGSMLRVVREHERRANRCTGVISGVSLFGPRWKIGHEQICVYRLVRVERRPSDRCASLF